MNEDESDLEVVDLSESDPSSGDTVIFEQEPYDPRPQEDNARRRIAYALLFILFLVCYGSFLSVLALPERLETVMRLVEFLFTPIVALVSAATGFYYGTKK